MRPRDEWCLGIVAKPVLSWSRYRRQGLLFRLRIATVKDYPHAHKTRCWKGSPGKSGDNRENAKVRHRTDSPAPKSYALAWQTIRSAYGAATNSMNTHLTAGMMQRF